MGRGLGGERNIVFSQRWYRNITVKWWKGRRYTVVEGAAAPGGGRGGGTR
jgi:hypothetical protein